MHHETSKALPDFYPLGDKNDFFAACLYQRYPEHFTYHANLASGLPAVKPAEKVA
jgi:hypothetical protein